MHGQRNIPPPPKKKRFSQDTPISNFMELFPVEAQLFHAEKGANGQTDNMTKMIVTFRSFTNASKNRQRPVTGFISNRNQY